MQKRALKVIAGAEIPVIAAYSDTTRKLTLANYKCQCCNTSVVSNRVVTPSCPVCAETLEETASDALVLSRAEVDDLAYLGHCDQCDTHINSSMEIVAELSGTKIHCPVCAAPVDVEELPAEVDEESEDEPTDDMEEIDASDEFDEESDDSEDMSEDNLDEEMPDDSEDEMSDDTDEVDMSGEDAGDLDEEMPDDSEDEMSDDADEVDMSGEDADASPVPETDDSEDEMSDGAGDLDEEMPDDSEEGDDLSEDDDLTAEAALIDYIKEGASYELILSGADPNNRRYFLFVDSVPVAIATKANASEKIAKLYGTEKFASAFDIVASEDLTTESIKDFGFEPIKVTVPVDQVAQQQTKDLLAKKDDEVKATLKDISDKFIQAVGISAVGYNKGVFSSENNGIREYLISELTKNRVRSAAKLVDSAFEKYGEGYLRTIIAKATELSRKSPDTIAEVAEMVATASYRASATASVEEIPAETTRVVPFSTTAAHHETEVVADDEDSFEAQLNRVTARLGDRRH